MYTFLDIAFFVFHSLFILSNLLGWIWKKTRKMNLILLLLTAFSWFILGIWYGIGFCPCTEWHYQVRWKLGYTDMPYSYIKFILDSLTGLDFNAKLIDTFTLAFFLIALTASIFTNIRDWKRKKMPRGKAKRGGKRNHRQG